MTTIYTVSYLSSDFVTLTPPEIDAAFAAGKRIRIESEARGLKDRRDVLVKEEKVDAEKIQQLGALSEQIVGKYFGLYVSYAYNTFRTADLPFNIEVRTIGREHFGLRVYAKDDDSRRVVGVVIPPGMERGPKYRIAGWIVAGDAKKHWEWTQNPYNAGEFFGVPQASLRHIKELVEIIGRGRDTTGVTK